MRALLVDRSVPGGLRLGEAPDPEPAPHQAVVRIAATSLNYGEIRYFVPSAPEGAVLGLDAAGVVVRAAADGTGPAVGTPVVALADGGAWAELCAVDTERLAVVPAGADPGAVSTVPAAGTTALRALHRLGPILGRRVLVTGATGGVGRYAVQLARIGGAHVIATTGDPEAYGRTLTGLGAHEVLEGPHQAGDTTVDGVLDLVGGRQRVDGYAALRSGGTLVAVGHATDGGETFPSGAFLGLDGRHERSLVTFNLAAEAGLGRDMAWLADRVAARELEPGVSWHGGWDKVAEATDALMGRRLHGKAVLDLG
ncbi:zinc-binding dehydrogenase [Streptomyces sp. B6B3]|uniref:zinc-binding dehydrogenase n=1 Tax=Streptomyces sp. B6B3 TaxID=3153570 RepID=UPI00325D4E67